MEEDIVMVYPKGIFFLSYFSTLYLRIKVRF